MLKGPLASRVRYRSRDIAARYCTVCIYDCPQYNPQGKEAHIDDGMRMGNQRLAHAQMHAAPHVLLLAVLPRQPNDGTSCIRKVPACTPTP